jgi:hypothetical protein
MFLRAGGFIRYQEFPNVRLAIYEALGVDLLTHNRQKCNEMATILLDDNMGAERDIILHQQGGRLQRISDRHPAYDPVYFPLLFPHGGLGWHLVVRYQGDSTTIAREFHVVSLPHTDSTSKPVGCCHTLQD